MTEVNKLTPTEILHVEEIFKCFKDVPYDPPWPDECYYPDNKNLITVKLRCCNLAFQHGKKLYWDEYKKKKINQTILLLDLH